MSATLALYPDAPWLQGAGGVLSWQRLTPDGVVVDGGEISVADKSDPPGAEGVEPRGMPERIDGEDVVVVIPGQLVVELTVALPPGKKRQLLPALPYLVEDELAVAVETLHFALLEASGNGEARTAVIERRILARLLEGLGAVQLHPTVVVADNWLLPAAPGAVTVLARDAMVLAKSAPNKSCAVDNHNREMALAALCEGQVADTLALINPRDESRWRLWAAGVGITRVTVQHVDDPLALLGAQIPSRPREVNLLQGEFAPSRQRSRAALWRNIAAAVALLAGLQLIYFVSAGGYFAHRAVALERQAETRYREIFPADQKLVNIRSQAEGHLRDAAGSGAAGFMEQIKLLAGAWKSLGAEPFTLRGLRYDGRESALYVDVDATSIQRVDQLIAALHQLGSGARLQTARGENGGVRANLIIGGKGE